MSRLRKLCAVSVLSVAAVVGSACKETGAVQVSSIKFSGNKAIDSASLKKVIATQESSVLPFRARTISTGRSSSATSSASRPTILTTAILAPRSSA
jgi:hypothetical protein